jgi:hypothetical protein
VSKMLTTAQCDDREKVLFAAGRLLWQPAQENTVLSPKTDPRWSLSNNKVSSCR